MLAPEQLNRVMTLALNTKLVRQKSIDTTVRPTYYHPYLLLLVPPLLIVMVVSALLTAIALAIVSTPASYVVLLEGNYYHLNDTYYRQYNTSCLHSPVQCQ